MPTLRRLMRSWEVSVDTIGDLALSDGSRIRVAADAASVTLKTGPRAGRIECPTGPGIYVKIAPIVVPRVIQWQMIQVYATLPVNPLASPRTVTALRARLWDGTTEFWRTGGAWVPVVTATTDWNTLEELNAGLPSWDPALPLGLVFELSTTDSKFSPAFLGFNLLFSIDIVSSFDDWIYGAVIQGLKDAIRGFSDVIVSSDGTGSIDFGSIVADFEDDMTIDTVDAVWNEDDDPIHRADLLASYDDGSQTIALTTAPPAGAKLLIRFVWIPLVALSTSGDYDELASTPAIVLDRVAIEDLGENASGDAIVNVFTDPPLGVVLPPPRRTNILISLTLMASLAVDLHRLAEAVTCFLTEHQVITSPSTGERATLRLTAEFDDAGTPDLDDLKTGTMAFSLENVYNWVRPAVAAGEPGGELAYGIGRASFTVQTETASEEIADFIPSEEIPP